MSSQNVQDTAFWVAHYRANESARSDALFRDPFAARLSGEKGQAFAEAMGGISRYTEWSIISRTVIIDRMLLELAGSKVDTVINLGAGLDARPYRLDLPSSLRWIEADHPTMIEYKAAALASEMPRCQLSRVSVDLADARARRAFLQQAAGGAKHAAVLSEGLVPYLSEEQVSELAKDLLAQPTIEYWIVDYFHPRTYAYLRKAAENPRLKESPFLFYPQDWIGFFEKNGWKLEKMIYKGEVALESGRAPPMPLWAKLLMPFLPKRVREEGLKSSGYMRLVRSRG